MPNSRFVTPNVGVRDALRDFFARSADVYVACDDGDRPQDIIRALDAGKPVTVTGWELEYAIGQIDELPGGNYRVNADGSYAPV